MSEKDFITNYLQPSDNRLDRTFTHPLPPDIEGLKKCGDFIVQGELEDTFSTNIIRKYVSDTAGIKLVEVYKNTQNKVTGVFIRLVGTMSLVKNGYPFLFFRWCGFKCQPAHSGTRRYNHQGGNSSAAVKPRKKEIIF